MPSPVSPQVRRGMLLRLTASQTPPWGLAFPLNPESLHRALIAVDTGRPQETITFTLRLDATDALGDRDPLSTQVGLHPQVAVLERLLRPPTDGGVTLFSWGSRALPVTVTELAVDETLFDTALNRPRARHESCCHAPGRGLGSRHDRVPSGDRHGRGLRQWRVKPRPSTSPTSVGRVSATGSDGSTTRRCRRS